MTHCVGNEYVLQSDWRTLFNRSSQLMRYAKDYQWSRWGRRIPFLTALLDRDTTVRTVGALSLTTCSTGTRSDITVMSSTLWASMLATALLTVRTQTAPTRSPICGAVRLLLLAGTTYVSLQICTPLRELTHHRRAALPAYRHSSRSSILKGTRILTHPSSSPRASV